MAKLLSESLKKDWDVHMKDLDSELEHTDKDAAVKSIDARIDQLQATTRELMRPLRSRRNAMAPISFLPPEVLCLIFHHLVYAVNANKFDPSPVITWPPLVQVTQVCRAWRTAALSFPSLWSIIDFSSEAVAVEMLQRSANSLLFIFLCSTKAWVTFLSMKRSRLPLVDPMRLKELHIAGRSFHLESALQHILTCARNADNLQTLRLYTSLNEIFTIPKELFTMSMQRLRHLDITGCNFLLPWSESAILATCDFLTNLVTCRLFLLNPLSRKQVYQLLSKMLNLQSLDVNDCFTTASCEVDFTWDAPIIQFSRLTHLTLRCNFSECQEFHKLVSYPVGGIIDFDLHHGYRNPPDVETSAIDYLIHRFRVGDKTSQSDDRVYPLLCYTNLAISIDLRVPSAALTTWNGTGNSIYTNLALPSQPLVKISLFEGANGWDIFPRILGLKIVGLKWLSIDFYHPSQGRSDYSGEDSGDEDSDNVEDSGNEDSHNEDPSVDNVNEDSDNEDLHDSEGSDNEDSDDEDSDDEDHLPAFTEEQWKTFFHFHEEITHLHFPRFAYVPDEPLAALTCLSPRPILPNLKAICMSVSFSHDQVENMRRSDYSADERASFRKLSAFSATPRGQSLQFFLIPTDFTGNEDLPTLGDIS